MFFDKVLIIGANKVACDCLESLVQKMDKTKLNVLESSDSKISMLQNLCKKNDVSYYKILTKKNISDFIEKFSSSSKVLIISANNQYLFSKSEVQNEKNIIINFHYALLPNYRGLNIPSWVIYNKESETGITWHYVDAKIDHGRIIKQKSMLIDDSTTAFDVVRWGMTNAIILFNEFIDELLFKGAVETFLPESIHGRIYYGKNIPANGCLNLTSSVYEISRLLRAYDYKCFELLPKLQLKENGRVFEVERYAITKMPSENAKRKIEWGEDFVRIVEDNLDIMIHVKTLSDLS